MLRVGLTGGTGAGKSTVAARLAELGARVIDADVLARRVLEPGTPGLAEVVATFGPEVLGAGGVLDRAALGRVVFADPELRRSLEGITHPRISALTRELVARTPDDSVVVHDVPLLVEKSMADRYHLVVVVDAPAESRVDRLVANRGMSADDAEARVRAQAGEAERRAAADVWLDNRRDREALLATVDDLWRRRLVPFEQNLRLRRLPPRQEHVVLSRADPSWPATAARLLARLATVTGREVLRADHIGSTSVPGLDAKDVIDLQLVVPDLHVAAEVGDSVAATGMLRRPGRWWDDTLAGGEHDKVLAAAADPGRPVNLHIREVASPGWRETVALRDLLRANPDQADAYAALKHRLADAGLRIDDYTAAKTDWIREAVDRARAAGRWPRAPA